MWFSKDETEDKHRSQYNCYTDRFKTHGIIAGKASIPILAKNQ
jgi:hypothetical protein